MQCDEISVGDFGTTFDFLIKNQDEEVVDVSDAEELTYHITKQDGSSITRTPSFLTDGTDGWIRYTTVAGDIDQAGIWQIKAYIELSGGGWFTETQTFRVRA